MNTENITLFLARAFEPLAYNLSSENALPFLYSLGLPTPNTDLDELVQSAGNVATKAEEMAALLPDFIKAVEENDKVQILESSYLVSTLLIEVISNIKSLSDKAEQLDTGGFIAEYENFVSKLPTRIINYLLVNHISFFSPNGYNTAVLLGLIDEKHHRDVRGVVPEFTEFIVHW